MLLGLFLIAGLVSLVSKLTHTELPHAVTLGNAEPDYIPPHPLHKEKRFVVATMRLEDPDEIERRANRIKRRFPGTAKVLLERASELREGTEEAIGLDSPFPGINDDAWTSFARVMARPKSDVTPTNHVGIFSLAYPRLVKLGKASKLRKEKRGTREVWTADFVGPLTLDKVLKSPGLQYNLFVESLKAYGPALDALKAWIGKTAEGRKVTQSGLMALLHKGGVDGAKAWLSSPGDRAKYPNTTAAFTAATELF